MDILPYDFDIIKVIKEGFRRIEGVKFLFVGGFAFYFLVALLLERALGVVFPTMQSDGSLNLINQQIITLLSYPVLLPIWVGLIMMAIKHQAQEPISWNLLFAYYPLSGMLAFAGVMVYFMTLLGFLLFLLPGIYLSIAYIFTFPLMVDKGLSAWEAMELSRKAVTMQWFKIATLLSFLTIFGLLGFFSFGITFIWAIPLFFVILYGLLYPLIFDEIPSV